tara:strand:- start:252 stop:566 length:315 start_codon:yes stop_codon:yes gene_type:complete
MANLGGEPNRDFRLSPFMISKIVHETPVRIVGTSLSFDWGESEILLLSSNRGMPCPDCESMDERNMLMKSYDGDIYACLDCNSFILRRMPIGERFLFEEERVIE